MFLAGYVFITLGFSLLVIFALVIALYNVNEFRKKETETLLALNCVEFECLQILVANDGMAKKEKFKQYHYKTLNDLSEDFDVLINSDGDVTGTYSNAFTTDRNKEAVKYALDNKPNVNLCAEFHLLSTRREPTS